MEALFITPVNAYLRYLDLPGEEPGYIYLGGLGSVATSVFTRVVWGSPLSRYRTILPDYLGCGLSDHPENFGYTISDHAEVLARLLDHLHLKACTLVGHSLGGAVAISLAEKRPELVSRLILAEANLDPGGGNFSQAIAAYSEQDFVEHGHRALEAMFQAEIQRGVPGMAAAAGMWQLVDPRAIHRSAANLVQGTQPSWRQLLYQLSIPRAYLFGEESLPDPDFETLPAHGIEVAVVPRAGHGMVWENPGDFARTISRLAAATA